MQRCLTLTIALLLGLPVTGLAAQENWLRDTRMTVQEPIQIPGAILEPGTYLIRMAQTTDRHVVEFWTENREELVMTTFSVGEIMDNYADDVMLRFEERPAHEPVRLDVWFYPGYMTGLQFLYDEDAQNEVVMEWTASQPETRVATRAAEPARGEALEEGQSPTTAAAPAQTAATRQSSTTASRPQAEAAEESSSQVLAQNQGAATTGVLNSSASSNQTLSSSESSSAALPRTATPMPLVALIGFATFAVGWGIGRFR
jgi:hypothetical protein